MRDKELLQDIIDGNVENIQRRIDDGWNVDEHLNECESTILHVLSDLHFNSSHAILANYLIQSGADINKIDDSGITALGWAVNMDNFQFADILLEAGADLHFENEFSCSYLRELIFHGSLDTIKVFINKGYVLKQICRNYSGPNENIVLNTYDDIVEFLLNTIGIEELKSPMAKYPVLLQFFIQHRDVKRFKQLSKEFDTSDILQTDNRIGKTILEYAVKGGILEIVQHLFELGANLNDPKFYSEGRLFYSAVNKSRNHKNTDVIEFLLEKGAVVNKKYALKNTTLISNCVRIMALYEKNHDQIMDVMNLLLRHDTNVNMLDVYHEGYIDNTPGTPLLRAVEYCVTNCSSSSTRRYEDVVRLLLYYGADVNARHHKTRATPLDILMTSFDKGGKSFSESSVTYLLISFIAKAKAAGEVVSKPNIDLVHENELLHDYYNQCEIEIQHMRKKRISENSLLSYYDFFANSSNIHKLGNFARNEDVMAILGYGDYEMLFPVYADVIEWNVEFAQERLSLILKSTKLLKKMLSPDVLNEIFEYLTNKDLRFFIKAFISM